MNVLNVAIFAEDVGKGLLIADVPFERGDMKSVRRRVDCN